MKDGMGKESARGPSQRRSHRRSGRSPRRMRAWWRSPERLERRDLLANFAVTTVASEGEGSLVAAILAANENPGGDTISFQLPTDAPYVIQVN